MNRLYAMVGTSRQSHRDMLLRRQALWDQLTLLDIVLAEERAKHPSMSLKKMYRMLEVDFIGRDAFVDYGMENGFEPIFNHKKPQLTKSHDAFVCPNRLHDFRACDINQVWVSDITYFKVHGKWCYITLIEDLYSRRIIGWNAAENLFAQANMKALELAIQNRGVKHFNQKLIHHSDRGVQYRSDVYAQKLVAHGIQISMGYSCYDNAFMESTNNIIKNEYLCHRSINNCAQLQYHLDSDVQLYNNRRPHGSLNLLAPVQFERYICNIPINQRTFLPIYTDKSKKHKLLIINNDPQQLKLF